MAGGATGNMPLELPAGFAGITPQLFLSYSNNTGLSNLGYGFTLGGLSVISRTGQSYYYDNNTTAVNFTNNDRFILDGQRLLVKTGTNGNNGANYVTENDSYSTISSIGTLNNAPDMFKVITKDGTELIYGQSDSKVTVVNSGLSTVTLMWPIKQITDKRGNRIVFNYSNTANGELKLVNILYTINNTGAVSAQYKVNFTYNQYGDPDFCYIGGRKILNSLYITQIYVTDLNTSAEIVKYAFTYTNNKVTGINKYYKGNLACNPTIINWNKPNIQNNFLTFNEWSAPAQYDEFDSYTAIPGDFNGDRKQDILYINSRMNNQMENNDWKLYSENNGIFKVVSSGFLPPLNKHKTTKTHKFKDENELDYVLKNYVDESMPNLTVKRSDNSITFKNVSDFPYMPIDVDNDGILELAVVTGNKDWDADNCNLNVYKISGSELVEVKTKKDIGLVEPGAHFIAADFIGKGQVDLMLVNYYDDYITIDQTYLLSNNKYDFMYDLYSTIPNYLTYFKTIGNSKTDLLLANDNNIYIYSTNYDGNEYVFNKVASINGIKPVQIICEDYNSDGLTDILVFNGNLSKWQLYFSKSNNTFDLQSDSFLSSMNNSSYTSYGQMIGNDEYPNYYYQHGNSYPEKAFFSIDPRTKYFDKPSDCSDYYSRKANGESTAVLDNLYKTTDCSKYYN